MSARRAGYFSRSRKLKLCAAVKAACSRLGLEPVFEHFERPVGKSHTRQPPISSFNIIISPYFLVQYYNTTLPSRETCLDLEEPRKNAGCCSDRQSVARLHPGEGPLSLLRQPRAKTTRTTQKSAVSISVSVESKRELIRVIEVSLDQAQAHARSPRGMRANFRNVEKRPWDDWIGRPTPAPSSSNLPSTTLIAIRALCLGIIFHTGHLRLPTNPAQMTSPGPSIRQRRAGVLWHAVGASLDVSSPEAPARPGLFLPSVHRRQRHQAAGPSVFC